MAKKQPEKIKDKTLLEFPENVSDGGTYIEFTFYKNVSEKKVSIDSLKELGLEAVKFVTKTNPNKKANYESCGQEVIKKNTKNKDIIKEIFIPKIEIYDRILLFFPVDMEIINSIDLDWSVEDAGLIGMVANLLKNKTENEGLIDVLMKKEDLLKDIGMKKLAKSNLFNLIPKVGKAIGSVAGKLADAHEMLKSFKGINPKIDSDYLKFNDIARREPEFDFRLIPTTTKEIEIVKKILSKFQMYSYPDDRSTHGIEYPLSVKAKVYVNDVLIMNYNLMKIENVRLNKSPEGRQFFYDSSSIVQDLSIKLKENDRYYLKEFLKDYKEIIDEGNDNEA